MRHVESWEVERAYYGDPRDPDSLKAARDNRNVIGAVFRRHGLRDDGDLHGLHATWRCLRSHQEGRQKFTSSLHRFAYWECKEQQRERTRKRSRPFAPLPPDLSTSARTDVHDLISLLPEPDQRLLKLQLKGYTVREIAKHDGRETRDVQAQIDGAIAFLRSKHG